MDNNALCGGSKGIFGECGHMGKCDVKIKCTTSTDVLHDRYNLYCVEFGKCMRDDTQLITNLRKCIIERDAEIIEMQECIDRIKAELEERKHKNQIVRLTGTGIEIENNGHRFPREPIKVADMLIYAKRKRIDFMTGKEYDKSVYETWELKQIAEHLLVYCNNAEVD